MKSQIILVAALFIGLNTFASEKVNPTKNKNTTKTEAVTAEAPVNVCLSGTIVDEQTKETLAGVEVTIEGTNLKTYTDFEGNFSFDTIAPGTYKVVTKYVSYNKVESKVVNVKSNEMHALNLELSAQTSSPQIENKSNQPMLAGK